MKTTHREALLAAAGTLLRTQGYGNITARDLVAASNTNLGSIGYHFGSKEALLNEAIGNALEEWAETMAKAADAGVGKTPLERLKISAAALLDEFEHVRPYHLAFIEALARSAHSPELAAQLARHYERQRDRVAGVLTSTFGLGLDPSVVRQIATTMIAVTDGLMLQLFADPTKVPTSEELASNLQALVWMRSGGARP
ncbi:MAG TPA: TetR/AcrR family transcriptional regulator [Solirubrobacteraceae bacterium]|nr:TetR/AcrR family transcriptional regulator [Solirubrobacteraceae bacterium]